MSTSDLAKQIALEEDRARKTAIELLKPMEGVKLGLADLGTVLGDIKDIGEKQLEKLQSLEDKTKPHDKHPYHTGVKNIATATAAGIYPELENIITALDYAAWEGTIFNFGPGAIFFVLSKDGTNFSGNETKLESKMAYIWTTDDRYPVNYMHVRTDTNNTSYQVVAG